MNPASKSKACEFKGRQKSFFLHQNRVASCCRAHADELNPELALDFYLQKWTHERQQLAQGVELAGCEHCWIQERSGHTSYRLIGKDTNKIELFLSNLCNQMCSYCSPKFSSTWQDSIQQQGMLERISTTSKQNLQIESAESDVDHWIDEINQHINSCDDDSVVLKILGGEPLMQQRNLERLLSMNSNKIRTLGIHTNLNPPTDKFLRWLLQHIPANKLNFEVSIDSSPGYNHWPRARFDQARFEQNLDLLTQHQIPTGFFAVISVLSVFDLPNFIPWAQSQNKEIFFLQLNNPACLDAGLLPQRFRQQIWNGIQNLDPPKILQEILQQETKHDSLKLFEQYNYLKQYFERNDLDPTQCANDLFKQYWAWLIENHKL